MRIWVDADALPSEARRILLKAAERVSIHVCLVANKPLKVPASPLFSTVVVGAGADVADDWIVEALSPGDLVITADIPLASRAVDRGASGLDPRGYTFTGDNVKERLAMRNLLDHLRGADMMIGGGPPAYGKKDVQKFADALNRWCARAKT
jgi:uncharacterized protein YaiI (UPF0178 family)